MNIKHTHWIVSLSIGLGISLLIAVFVRTGIPFVLYLLDRWQISTLNTIILYAMLFIVAKAGTQLQGRKQRPARKAKETDESETPADDSKSVSVLSIAWSFIGIYAVLWVTPALIIYWIYLPPYPPQMTMLFAYLFSVATAAVYFFGNDDKFPSWKSKTSYFAGACLGPVVLDYVL